MKTTRRAVDVLLATIISTARARCTACPSLVLHFDETALGRDLARRYPFLEQNYESRHPAYGEFVWDAKGLPVGAKDKEDEAYVANEEWLSVDENYKIEYVTHFSCWIIRPEVSAASGGMFVAYSSDDCVVDMGHTSWRENRPTPDGSLNPNTGGIRLVCVYPPSAPVPHPPAPPQIPDSPLAPAPLPPMPRNPPYMPRSMVPRFYAWRAQENSKPTHRCSECPILFVSFASTAQGAALASKYGSMKGLYDSRLPREDEFVPSTTSTGQADVEDEALVAKEEWRSRNGRWLIEYIPGFSAWVIRPKSTAPSASAMIAYSDDDCVIDLPDAAWVENAPAAESGALGSAGGSLVHLKCVGGVGAVADRPGTLPGTGYTPPPADDGSGMRHLLAGLFLLAAAAAAYYALRRGDADGGGLHDLFKRAGMVKGGGSGAAANGGGGGGGGGVFDDVVESPKDKELKELASGDDATEVSGLMAAEKAEEAGSSSRTPDALAVEETRKRIEALAKSMSENAQSAVSAAHKDYV